MDIPIIHDSYFWIGVVIGGVFTLCIIGIITIFVYGKIRRHKHCCQICLAKDEGEQPTTAVYATYVHTLLEKVPFVGTRNVTTYVFRVCHKHPLVSDEPHITWKCKHSVKKPKKIDMIPREERDLTRPYIQDLFKRVGLPNPADRLNTFGKGKKLDLPLDFNTAIAPRARRH